MHGPFEAHLCEAIALNTARRPIYADATDGRSWWLSTWLITAEQATRPVARWLDRRAQPHNAAGIGIVADDFESMEAVGSTATPPTHRGRLTLWGAALLQLRVRRYRRKIQRAAVRRDFGAIERRSAALLRRLRRTERRQGVHLAMTVHLVESIGFAAAHAPTYREQSEGRTDALARDLLLVQSLGLPLAIPTDRTAQRHHQAGVGIVVHDVPPIAFA
ncbi:MAG: hypothetical protein KC912_13570 [Proteobacteria bacterium]|nr:hypothetical protein [Pseudomonadota bacterium]